MPLSLNDETIALQEAYTQIQTSHVEIEYGPIRAYRDGHTIQALWHQVINPVIASMLKSGSRQSDGRHVVSASSPWHAYFYLRAQHQFVYRGGKALGESESEAKSSIGDHMYFRGQRCADWPFQSSLHRLDKSARGEAERATAVLAEYFRITFANDLELTQTIAICFAQHYGIPTKLADVSCDPDIAVWFATHPLNKTCTSDEPNATVRAVTWAAQIATAPVRVLIPPAFVRNVYTQRGLFLDTGTTDGQLVGSIALEVNFPRETVGGEFVVLRDGKPLDIWPAQDKYEHELILWAQEVARETKTLQEAADHARSLKDHKKFPKFHKDRKLNDFESHVNAWLTSLDWILPSTCIIGVPVSNASAPMAYKILNQKVEELAKANSSLFRAFIHATKGGNFKNFESLKKVLEIANSVLA
jgi:FRG domain